MKQLIKFVFLSLLLIAPTISAKTISDVNVSETINISNQKLILNGAGVRSKFFFDLYVGSLYLPKSTTDANTAIDSDVAAIRLNITSGMITPEKMQEAVAEGFEHATHKNIAPIQTQIDEFIDLFGSGIKEGDQFTFVSHKNVGITAYKNGKQLANIKGEGFRKALFQIWLGDKPAQKSLKKKMLGK
ncbi:MAG: chalcone isomerase family protein [Parashewanella sp.]